MTDRQPSGSFLTDWRWCLTDVLGAGLAHPQTGVRPHVHPRPIEQLDETPALIVYPGGPGSYIDSDPDDEDTITFCMDTVFWSVWMFAGVPYNEAAWAWLDFYAEHIGEALKACKGHPLNPTPDLYPTPFRIDQPAITELGGSFYLAASTDIKLPIQYEGANQ